MRGGKCNGAVLSALTSRAPATPRYQPQARADISKKSRNEIKPEDGSQVATLCAGHMAVGIQSNSSVSFARDLRRSQFLCVLRVLRG